MADYFHMDMDACKIGAISNLGLAHLGDAVYELLVRTRLCTEGQATAKGLHYAAVQQVSAPAQAKAAEKLMPHLTEEEQKIYRRGRNTRTGTIPQSASVKEYHAATGLETLFGYLYLRGETARIGELFAVIVEG